MKVRTTSATLTVAILGSLLMLSSIGHADAAAIDGRGEAQPASQQAVVTQQASVTTTVSIDSHGRVSTTSVVSPVASQPHHPSRVLVRFRAGTSFLPRSGSSHGFAAHPGLYLVENPPGLSVEEVVRRYHSNPNVLYAEPDFVVRTTAAPNDPAFLTNQQYDMTKIAAPAAWDTQTDASDVVVAVVDTGIDFTHPDLQGNLYTGAGGLHGYTCINSSCVAGGEDDYGHGTHVAGTIGAATNNGIGMAGINWFVQLLSIKFLNSSGSGFVSDAVIGFDQILALKNSGVNIRVTNNSWGSSGFSQALKDAMIAVENAGIVNVCAAGNSSQNEEVMPFYPAAFDNRGLISVLATDANDVGANFTNYGLASVDIAAPGVNTFSTVPAGTCALCDPSGYKLLSGTSMATPHVTGVVAAVLHRYPSLTASLARDAILNPDSYDAVLDSKAQTSSTGGRLNFFKTINNTGFLSNPTLNNFPVLTVGPDVNASAGNTVTLSATATDADNDLLRFSRFRQGDLTSLFLFGWGLASVFPDASANPSSFIAPTLGRVITVPYRTMVADGRGGSAAAANLVTVSRSATPAQPPSGRLSVSSNNVPVGTTIEVDFPLTVPAGGQAAWQLSTGGGGLSCCWTTPYALLLMNQPGVYRVGGQAIDQQLNLSARQTTLVTVGGATAQPPLANATFDRLTGPAPLTVNIDMSGSTDADGTVTGYVIGCEGPGSASFVPFTSNPKGTCTYTTPGPHYIYIVVLDNSLLLDTATAYAMVTAPDTLPPTVAITSPADGATLSGPITVAGTASATDVVTDVAVAIDDGAYAGATGTTSWTYALDARALTAGSHKITARATDDFDGTTATSINVTVQNAAPSIAITSPTNNASVTGTITVAGTAADDFAVAGVLVRVDDGPASLASGTTNWSYSLDTNTVSGGTHTIYAQAVDAAGQTATASVVVDATDIAPVVVIDFPKNNNYIVPKGVTGFAANGTASDADGTVAAVQRAVDGGPYTTCQGTTSWSCGVPLQGLLSGKHTLTVIAIDNRGVASSGASIRFSTK
ncbi:MAG TPA: S8 family serine peptidase [Thermoanaerobaculia bacterium]|nr:S8 family serine peptidase [Thermoanaerobaculia bacterium]